MEKAILKTLIYADIFDYPLTIYEIHKWLIGKKTTLRQVEKTLKQLTEKRKIKTEKGYYFLPKRLKIISKRQRRRKHAIEYFKKARILTAILKIIPWIKLVGVSGGLAMENTQKKDDIDLFIITSRNRLWVSRLLALGLLSLIRQRRKVKDQKSKVAGKLCLNILLEEDKLAQKQKDIYLAHEVLQMKVLWQRDDVYQRYLVENQWVFGFLPNWVGEKNKKKELGIKSKDYNLVIDILEKFAKSTQLKIMHVPQGKERIEDGALYFHPYDLKAEIIKEFKIRVRKLFSTS